MIIKLFNEPFCTEHVSGGKNRLLLGVTIPVRKSYVSDSMLCIKIVFGNARNQEKIKLETRKKNDNPMTNVIVNRKYMQFT